MAQLSATNAPPNRARLNLSSAVFVVGAFYLWSLVLEAPLRYGLTQIHLNVLIYLPKLILLVAVILLPVLRSRATPSTLLLSCLILLYLIWGMLNLNTPLQPMFGLWVLVPLLFGLWAAPIADIEQWYRLFLFLFIVAAAGVFINTLIQYPWNGQSLNLLGNKVQLARQWTALGLQRYAGFSRVSYAVASQLLLFGVMLIVLIRRKAIKLLVWLVAGTGIALTTSKGPFGAWLMLSIYFAGGRLLRWPRYWIQLWLAALSLITLSLIILPISTLWIHYNPTLHSFVGKFLFASFGDRLDKMWPHSLHLLDLGGAWHWMIGRGLGGIGIAQKYFEPAHQLPGDNLFVYVVVYFGLPVALLLFGALWFRIVRVSLRPDTAAWRLPVILALISYGVVTNEIENSILALFLGLSIVAHDGQAQSMRKLHLSEISYRQSVK